MYWSEGIIVEVASRRVGKGRRKTGIGKGGMLDK